MTNPGMKCTRCRGPANHRFPAHNARFCDDCLELFIHRQVERAIKKYDMLRPGQGVMVAVSGGKDSLSLWRILSDLGYATRAVHVSLGLGEFSDRSLEACRAMAGEMGQEIAIHRLEDLTGFSIEQVARANRREFCAICGLVKRYFLNRLAIEAGFDTVATGHHLDDEAGRLLGNTIHRRQEYLDNQWPVLLGLEGKLAKRIKPLCRLSGTEVKGYAKSKALPVSPGKCPRSKGATLNYYQEALDLMELRMPGTKRDFYFGFLADKDGPPPPPRPDRFCERCGAPTYLDLCNCCRMLARTRGEDAPVTVPDGSADPADD